MVLKYKAVVATHSCWLPTSVYDADLRYKLRS